jgi:hypothetical protein
MTKHNNKSTPSVSQQPLVTRVVKMEAFIRELNKAPISHMESVMCSYHCDPDCVACKIRRFVDEELDNNTPTS